MTSEDSPEAADQLQRPPLPLVPDGPLTADQMREMERAREDATDGWDDVVDKSFPASDPPPTG
ncbi:MAG: hypothetical protein ABR598_00775 [Candidatus Dormibacteria bacterium]